MKIETSTQKVALEFIARGWAVFPLVPGGKIPATKNGFKDATLDAETAERLFSSGTFNLGLATGAKSGLVVVDFDTKSGGLETLELLRSKLPETLTVKTGGGGVHLYYAYPKSGTIRNKTGLFQGVDIRADGGYVVAPPSRTQGDYTFVNLETPIVELPEWLLERLVEKPSLNTTSTFKPASKLPIRGELAKSTLDFLLNGAPKGTWNPRLFKAAKDYQEQGLSKEDFIERALLITGHLDNTDMSTIESAFKNQPKYGPRITQNNALREQILASYLINDIKDISKKVFISFDRGKIYDIDPKHIDDELSKEERASFLKNNRLKATFTYNPLENTPLTIDDNTGTYIYNWYNPPEWKREHFFFKKDIEVVDKIPEIYDRFFTHLTNGHIESKEYILDWMANSLHRRNYTILTAIGKQGIGKGILSNILQSIHGIHNFVLCTDMIFKEKFNGKLQNKTLVYVDEISLVDKSSHDRVKAVVNDELEIEKKGEDAVTSKNYASFYITSNHFDAVRISYEDRRYSVVQLTDTKILETDLKELINTEILNNSNLDHLARYLYGRKVKYDMLKPFRSKRFEEMLDAGLNFWEEWFLDEFLPPYKGKEPIDLRFIQKEIKELGILKNPPSRRTIEALQKRFPSRFEILRSGADLSKRKIKVL